MRLTGFSPTLQQYVRPYPGCPRGPDGRGCTMDERSKQNELERQWACARDAFERGGLSQDDLARSARALLHCAEERLRFKETMLYYDQLLHGRSVEQSVQEIDRHRRLIVELNAHCEKYLLEQER